MRPALHRPRALSSEASPQISNGRNHRHAGNRVGPNSVFRAGQGCLESVTPFVDGVFGRNPGPFADLGCLIGYRLNRPVRSACGLVDCVFCIIANCRHESSPGNRHFVPAIQYRAPKKVGGFRMQRPISGCQPARVRLRAAPCPTLSTDSVDNPMENPMTDRRRQELARSADGTISEQPCNTN